MKKTHLTHKLAAMVTAGALMGEAGSAAAQTNFTDVTNNITNSASQLPNLISTVAYIGGIGLGVAGVFKLKAHVDSPGQTPLKDGLIRLGAGGGLLALPFLTEAMTGTVGASTGGPTVSTFDTGGLSGLGGG